MRKEFGKYMASGITICITTGMFLALVVTSWAANNSHVDKFEDVTVPSATYTEVTGVSLTASGKLSRVVGFYIDSTGITHGFVKAGSKITTIDVPGATGTHLYGEDQSGGEMVGSYTDSNSVEHGFLLAFGKLTTFDVPGAMSTRAYSVNLQNTIVGSYTDENGVTHGFLQDQGKGGFRTLDVNNATFTEVRSIANYPPPLGFMAANFVDASGKEHGETGQDAIFLKKIDFPGAEFTTANAVAVSGGFFDGYFGASASGPFHGYVWVGKFLKVDFPGAVDTRCNGIDDALQIGGRYTDANGVVHGFTAQVEYTTK